MILTSSFLPDHFGCRRKALDVFTSLTLGMRKFHVQSVHIADRMTAAEPLPAGEALRRLADGGRVAGVASCYSYFPDATVKAADMRVEPPAFTTEIIETVIRRMSRKRVTVPAGLPGWASMTWWRTCAQATAPPTSPVSSARRRRSAVDSVNLGPHGRLGPHGSHQQGDAFDQSAR